MKIVIDGKTVSETPDPKIGTISKSFLADNLNISNLIADLEVLPGDSKEIEVEITGPEDSINSVLTEVRDTTVFISGGKEYPRLGISIKSEYKQGCPVTLDNISGLNISLSQGIIIDGDIADSKIQVTDKRPNTKVLVRVPKGTPLNISEVSGLTIIGETGSPLYLTLSGRAEARTGPLNGAYITLSGYAQAFIGNESGPFSITVSDHSKVRTGTVHGQLSINARDHAEVIVACLFEGPVSVNSLDHSVVDIKNGSTAILSLNTSGHSKADFDGRSQTASLNASDHSNINVRRVESHRKINVTMHANVNVGN